MDDFNKLKKEWYDKLKATGFKDIEAGRESNSVWQEAHIVNNGKYNRFYTNVDYYRAAGVFLHHYSFESDTDKQIWELHTEGESIRTIANKLSKSSYFVHKTINTLRNLMLKQQEKDSEDEE